MREASERLTAGRAQELPRLLAEVERRMAAGQTLWGLITYEAANAFDPALATRRPEIGTAAPLATFLVEGDQVPRHLRPGPWRAGRPRAELGRDAYRDRIAAIHAAIARGDTYQVNFTMRLRARFAGDPLGLFLTLAEAQNTPGLCLDLGDQVIASASPELFLERRGARIITRPMKGTANRGVDGDQDARLAAALLASPKERAENLMIVDMLRNDLGRIARPGSVSVEALFELERYPTVWQMTSTIAAESEVGLVELLRATFPCASITGAPKVSTMRLISELEGSPRGVYTGAIGRFGPGRDLELAVGIRTAVIDRRRGRLEYGVGSGVTWDSRPGREHAECLAKAAVLSALAAPQLRLLETLRSTPSGGPLRLGRHLARLAESAARLGFALPDDLAPRILSAAATSTPRRLRVLLGRDQSLELELTAVPERIRRPLRLVLAAHPIPEQDWRLAHKTNDRRLYDHLLATTRERHPDCEDAMLWSREVGITETTIANLLYRLDGRWYTPPADGRLLAGCLRAALLARGRVRERPLQLAELPRVERWVVASSLRGLRAALVVD